MKWIVVAITLAFLSVPSDTFLVSGYCWGSLEKNIKPMREYTDSSIPIKLKAGDEFTVVLDSNPTTGYSWQLAGKPDEAILKLLGSKFQPPKTQRRGAGGREFWTFKAVGAGSTAIVMKYVRPWEKDKPPAKKETFAVIVR